MHTALFLSFVALSLATIFGGNRFRIPPNVLLSRFRTASDDIYGMKANVKKTNFYEAWPRNDRDHHTLNTTDVHLHAGKRRIPGTVFTNNFTLEAVDTVVRLLDQWNRILTSGGPTDDSWSVAQDMSTAIDYLVFDFFVDLFFGRCLNTKGLALKQTPQASRSRQSHWMVSPKRYRRVLRLLEGFIAQNLSEDFQSKERQQTTHLRTLHTTRDPESGGRALSRVDILAEANMLMITGSHTTTVALKATLFYLVNDSKTLAMGPCYQLASTFEFVSKQVFLWRLPAPASFHGRYSPGGAVIDDGYYPEGIIVGISGWANGYDQEVYGDANIFRPERWIVSKTDHQRKTCLHSGWLSVHSLKVLEVVSPSHSQCQNSG
ncbi:cytochrome P450 [Phaeosphaeria sp. MPI-PUGE-AT-0046c]|nr:cytochrome P450 [Phaeosphaeria sp. MPI-PUGE-AT-0046c]